MGKIERVMIVGGPGSGKSTLARWIGVQTGLPVQHMDHIHWLDGWVERPQEERIAMISVVEAREKWVIEGGISKRYAERLARADMLVWLDLPVGLRMWRVLRRAWRYRGQARPDLPTGCPEQLNYQTASFLLWVWSNRNTSRVKILDLTEGYDGSGHIHHLCSKRDVTTFMRGFDGA